MARRLDIHRGMDASGQYVCCPYNLMFIVPLVAILVVTYLGVRSEAMGSFFRRNLAMVKLGLSAVFVVLGALVIVTI